MIIYRKISSTFHTSSRKRSIFTFNNTIRSRRIIFHITTHTNSKLTNNSTNTTTSSYFTNRITFRKSLFES